LGPSGDFSSDAYEPLFRETVSVVGISFSRMIFTCAPKALIPPGAVWCKSDTRRPSLPVAIHSIHEPVQHVYRRGDAVVAQRLDEDRAESKVRSAKRALHMLDSRLRGNGGMGDRHCPRRPLSTSSAQSAKSAKSPRLSVQSWPVNCAVRPPLLESAPLPPEKTLRSVQSRISGINAYCCGAQNRVVLLLTRTDMVSGCSRRPQKLLIRYILVP